MLKERCFPACGSEASALSSTQHPERAINTSRTHTERHRHYTHTRTACADQGLKLTDCLHSQVRFIIPERGTVVCVCVALTEQLHSVWLQHGLILVKVKEIFLLSFTPPHVIPLFWETLNNVFWEMSNKSFVQTLEVNGHHNCLDFSVLQYHLSVTQRKVS